MESYAINEDFVLDIYRAEVHGLAHEGMRITLKGYRRDRSLSLLNVETAYTTASPMHISLKTSDGDVSCFLHLSSRRGGAVIWVGAAGFEPAGGVYTALSQQLTARGISSLRLHCRFPHVLDQCILDAIAGIAFMKHKGFIPIALVGHSFAGAVVIDAGALCSEVGMVVALSSQVYGADLVEKVAPRPLLLIHGDADEILPAACSEILYHRAGEPKEIMIYSGTGHGLREAKDEVLELLKKRLAESLDPAR